MKISSLLILITSLVLVGCGANKPAQTATPSLSPTPDLCSPANLTSSVTQVNNLMRQFDDYASLASNTQQSQLVSVIPPMQAIRRAAEDQSVPPCLKNLIGYQLLYMNTTIQTLLAFQSNAKAETLNAGIAQARQSHDQYTLELAHLLGLTVVAPPSATAGAPAPQSTATAAPPSITVDNPSSNPVNLHVSASLTSQTVGSLAAGQSAAAFGKSPSGEWIQIELPGQAGQKAWAFANLLHFSSGDPASLPVITQ